MPYREELVYDRTRGGFDKVVMTKGRYRFELWWPDVGIAKAYWNHYLAHVYGFLFGPDKKATIYVPVNPPVPLPAKKAILHLPVLEEVDDGARLVFEYEQVENPPPLWAVIAIIGATLGLVAFAGSFFIQRVMRLVEVSGIGDIGQGIGEALKSAAQGGWLTPLLLVGGLFALVALLPKVITQGKKARAML